MNRWLFHCNQDIILENHFPLACAQSLGERAVGSKISISEELSKKRSSSIPHHYPCTHRHSKCSFIESVNKLKAQIVKKKNPFRFYEEEETQGQQTVDSSDCLFVYSLMKASR